MTETTENTFEDFDGENTTFEESFEMFKQFMMNMCTAGYEEAVLRYGLSKKDAKSLCIPAKLAKEFGFKCYQPEKPEVVTEEASEFDGESINE